MAYAVTQLLTVGLSPRTLTQAAGACGRVFALLTSRLVQPEGQAWSHLAGIDTASDQKTV